MGRVEGKTWSYFKVNHMAEQCASILDRATTGRTLLQTPPFKTVLITPLILLFTHF